MKSRIPKTVRNTIISIFLLLLLFIGAGIAYVLIADRSTPKAVPVAAVAKPDTDSTPKPTPPSANAPEGVSVESVTSPVAAATNSSITARTNAGSTCTIVVSYNGGQSTDSGLTSRTADAYGNVTWTWTVGSAVPAGTWPINVTCTYHGRSGVVQSSYQVTK
ncbi:MAG TPA: hypothetical protein VII55_02010 [Candidatus Saccharimonadales bacterium]